jgi:hypothetical protein
MGVVASGMMHGVLFIHLYRAVGMQPSRALGRPGYSDSPLVLESSIQGLVCPRLGARSAIGVMVAFPGTVGERAGTWCFPRVVWKLLDNLNLNRLGRGLRQDMKRELSCLEPALAGCLKYMVK